MSEGSDWCGVQGVENLLFTLAVLFPREGIDVVDGWCSFGRECPKCVMLHEGRG
jgi:hypothetical protein